MELGTEEPERAGILGPDEPDEPPADKQLDALLDLLPEFCVYKDTGCELAASCLDCPFPFCVDDAPHGRRKVNRMLRDREIVRLLDEGNITVRELSVKFKLTERTVYNALKRTGGKS